jgi:peptide deformylase
MEEIIETKPPETTPSEPPHPKVMLIHLLGSGVLRTPSIIVSEITDEIKALADIMVNTMHHVKGIGLAAPQVGIPLRLFVMTHKGEGRVLRLANPEINNTEGTQVLDEGCLSQPGLMVKVTRPKYLAVKCLDIDSGGEVIVEGTDLEAAILSHEIDHLNAKLICDYLSRLKRDIYKKKLKKKLKQRDRAEAMKDHRDHPHHVEAK